MIKTCIDFCQIWSWVQPLKRLCAINRSVKCVGVSLECSNTSQIFWTSSFSFWTGMSLNPPLGKSSSKISLSPNGLIQRYKFQVNPFLWLIASSHAVGMIIRRVEAPTVLTYFWIMPFPRISPPVIVQMCRAWTECKVVCGLSGIFYVSFFFSHPPPYSVVG